MKTVAEPGGASSVAGVRDTIAAEDLPAVGRETAEPLLAHAEPERDEKLADLEQQLAIRRLFHELDRIRIERGMTKAELARAARLSESHVCRLLLHGGNPRLSTLISLAIAVDCRLVLTVDGVEL